MIAFYTWTDTQILNALNLKTGTFPQEEADLFVLELARVSQPLLEQVRRQGVFRRIVRIPEPTDGRTGFVHVLAKLFSGPQYHAAFRNSVDLVPGEQYRLLITGGFWSYTVFLYRMLAKANPQLEVAFLEEGIASYDGASILYWCDPKSKLRSALMHLMFYPGMVGAAKRATKTLYLYCPEACMNRGQLTVLPMGPYTPQTLAVLQALGAHTDLDAYRTRPVIFFLQPEPDDELRRTVTWLNAAVKQFGGENVMIKPHPDSIDRLAALPLDPAVRVDTTRVSFDNILPQVDWSGKLLITKGTSCVFYPRYILGQEPDVVFLFKLYPHTRLKGLIERLALQLRAQYRNPQRVTVAQSDAQVLQALQNWQQRAESWEESI